jgi:hypothetical protein
MPTALNAEEWMAVLERLARASSAEGPPLRLCLIGTAACLFGGMEGRASADLDIWKPASEYDRLELKSAAEKAGLLFDPKTALEPDTPYLQLVEPGLTQLGEFIPVLVERLGRLHIYRPPVENLVAAKLIRAELAALVRYARRDVPVALAQTDPALYRQLREQITRFFLLGGDTFSLESLEKKAGL